MAATYTVCPGELQEQGKKESNSEITPSRKLGDQEKKVKR